MREEQREKKQRGEEQGDKSIEVKSREMKIAWKDLARNTRAEKTRLE